MFKAQIPPLADTAPLLTVRRPDWRLSTGKALDSVTTFASGDLHSRAYDAVQAPQAAAGR